MLSHAPPAATTSSSSSLGCASSDFSGRVCTPPCSHRVQMLVFNSVMSHAWKVCESFMMRLFVPQLDTIGATACVNLAALRALSGSYI